MFLNSLFMLNIYFFENLVFFNDNFILFSEINDVFFIFLLSFVFNKKIISLKSVFFKNFNSISPSHRSPSFKKNLITSSFFKNILNFKIKLFGFNS